MLYVVAYEVYYESVEIIGIADSLELALALGDKKFQELGLSINWKAYSAGYAMHSHATNDHVWIKSVELNTYIEQSHYTPL